MKQKTLFSKFLFLLCALIVGGVNSVWADETTYEFTSKSWGAKIGSTTSNWTSGKDGSQMQSGRGIQVTSSASGANATSPQSFSNISQIVVTYSTNANNGAGSIAFQVGSGTAKSQSVTKSGGTTDRTLTYNFSPEESGSVKITVTCTTNSIYVKSVKITYSSKTPAGLTFDTHEDETYTLLPGADFVAPSLSNPNSLTVAYSSSDEDIALVDEETGEIVVGTKEGTATITASSAETGTYAAGTAKYKIKVEKGTTTVTLNNSALTFNIIDGTTQTLTATATYDETSLDTPAITWTTSDDAVATVSGGVVTAVAPGTAIITASYAGNTTYAASSNTCAITVNKANTTISLTTSDPTTIDLKPANKATVRLNAAVKATKSDESQVAVESPTVTWTSSDPTVATVSDGVVTGLKVGTTTITASYVGGTNYNAAANQTCVITVEDTRTAVNMSTFTATTPTIIIGGSPNSTATAVTTDQNGWTPAYTYVSSNTSVASVAADGTVTAVAKGTATITATLNVANDDSNYKVGSTTSKTLDITVNKPSHTVTFSVNGNTDLTASVEEDAAIPFPTAVETTPGDGEFPKIINGQTFVGWYTAEYANASVAPTYVNTVSTNMGNSDVTYYAVYADVEENESDDVSKAVKSQTLSYDSWTYSGSTTDKSNNNYRLFHAGSYIESASFDLSKLIKVVVKGGTFGGGSYNSLTIGDGTNVWKNVTVSGSSETGTNTYTGGSALSGTNPLRIICNSGTASSTGVRISSVEIYVKGTVTTYSHFSTTVSDLPRPEITMADVIMTWGDDDKSVSPSAMVGEDTYEGSFTYVSSNNEHLTVASDGKLSSDLPGNYTVTARIAATGSHQAAEKTCNVIVNKQNPVVSFADATVQKMISDGNYTQTATKYPAAAGEISYSISPSGNDINNGTGTVTLSKTGNYTVTATAESNNLYNEAVGSYTLQVRITPTISVIDQTIAVGETYTPAITGGDVTITSNPAGVITVKGNVITAYAVVTGATITVATEANDTYVAGEESFTLTINGPEGLPAVPEPEDETVFYESFTGTNGSIESGWASSSGSGGTIIKDNTTGWDLGSSSGGAGNAVKLGSGSSNGTATTPSIAVLSGTVYTLTFKAAPWSTESTTMSLTVTGGTATGLSTETMSTKQWNNLSATITASASTMTIKFDATSEERFFLDEVRLTCPGDPISSVSVTIPASGYCSYCSMYPLDLPADNDNCKAYVATSVNGELVTLKRVRGEIKGGVPLIFIGTPNSYDIPTAEASTTVPYEDSNLLRGTLAPTYVTQSEGDYTNLGLSGSVFKKINSGVVPANKAYLHIPTSMMPASGSGSARMNIFIDDDDDVPTGVKSIDNGQLIIDNTVYNLKGQRVEKPVKGQLYIVNGKKVVIK